MYIISRASKIERKRIYICSFRTCIYNSFNMSERDDKSEDFNLLVRLV